MLLDYSKIFWQPKRLNRIIDDIFDGQTFDSIDKRLEGKDFRGVLVRNSGSYIGLKGMVYSNLSDRGLGGILFFDDSIKNDSDFYSIDLNYFMKWGMKNYLSRAWFKVPKVDY